MSQDIVAVFKLDPKHGIGKRFHYLAFEFDDIVFAQDLSFTNFDVNWQMCIVAKLFEWTTWAATCAISPN